MSKLNDDFVSDILDTGYFLENAIAWIKKNLNPEDVFNKDTLENWAEENGFTKE